MTITTPATPSSAPSNKSRSQTITPPPTNFPFPLPTEPGPTSLSNWVISSRLLAGAYPGDQDPTRHKTLIQSILAANVTTFVCLQTPNELRHFRSYSDTALSAVDPSRRDSLQFLNLSIPDGAIASDTDILEMAKDVVRRLKETEEVVYVHCWGGHGRTGTLIAVVLSLYYGVGGRVALDATQVLHDRRKNPRGIKSPQTVCQIDQVLRVCGE
ncbi:hypothetical protein HDV00_004409 [Rhizophlyctis rosea]|nr:hypothetical protein HDV00_004409 [Rhizophlyctis rosea]